MPCRLIWANISGSSNILASLKASAKYKEEELISPILIDKVSNNLFIIHYISYVISYFLSGLTIICLSSIYKIYETKTFSS